MRREGRAHEDEQTHADELLAANAHVLRVTRDVVAQQLRPHTFVRGAEGMIALGHVFDALTPCFHYVLRVEIDDFLETNREYVYWLGEVVAVRVD